jgi:uncharacterized protein DUF4145
MPPKHVVPAIDLKSFSCPHCGALADQSWFATFAKRIDKDQLPNIWTPARVDELRKEFKKSSSAEGHDHFTSDILPRLERIAQGRPAIEARSEDRYVSYDFENIFISRCYSCKDITIWRHDTILYPPTRYEMEPNPDLPADVRADFDEARSVLDLSPRSAAALLRLCIQNICKYLGEPGRNLNDDIGSLVRKGLNVRVQQALDVVRVVGNNAVHPGELDLTDDRETAAKLFDLVNRIAFDMISHPKEIDALFNAKVPQGAKERRTKLQGGTPVDLHRPKQNVPLLPERQLDYPVG